MTTPTLNRSGSNAMAGDGDGALWVSIFGVGGMFLGSVGTIFFNGVRYAAHGGRGIGSMETKIADLDRSISATEARMNLRMTQIEARKDRIDDRLELMATKQDMLYGFAEIKEQIRDLQKGHGYRSSPIS